jgi:hypothetical protein
MRRVRPTWLARSRPLGAVALWASVLAATLWTSPWGVARAEADPASSQRLSQRMQVLQSMYQAAHREAVARVNQQLGVDYDQLHQRYYTTYRLQQQKLSIVEQAGDGSADKAYDLLTEVTADIEQQLYAEASLVLDNELERSHLLRGAYLQGCEEVLDELIASDPLLSHIFRSAEYKNRYGLLLKRMVWRLDSGESALAKPLKAYTVFADRRQTPFLVLISPAAFDSLSFLRSILVHELNHVLLYKEPFGGVERPVTEEEGVPKQPAGLPYGWLFTKRFARTSSYQFHLVHEYYAFKAQLLYDDQVRGDPYRALPMKDRIHIEHLYAWALGELSGQSREVIRRSPDPPIITLMRQLGAREAGHLGAAAAEASK